MKTSNILSNHDKKILIRERFLNPIKQRFRTWGTRTLEVTCEMSRCATDNLNLLPNTYSPLLYGIHRVCILRLGGALAKRGLEPLKYRIPKKIGLNLKSWKRIISERKCHSSVQELQSSSLFIFKRWRTDFFSNGNFYITVQAA